MDNLDVPILKQLTEQLKNLNNENIFSRIEDIETIISHLYQELEKEGENETAELYPELAKQIRKLNKTLREKNNPVYPLNMYLCLIVLKEIYLNFEENFLKNFINEESEIETIKDLIKEHPELKDQINKDLNEKYNINKNVIRQFDKIRIKKNLEVRPDISNLTRKDVEDLATIYYSGKKFMKNKIERVLKMYDAYLSLI